VALVALWLAGREGFGSIWTDGCSQPSITETDMQDKGTKQINASFSSGLCYMVAVGRLRNCNVTVSPTMETLHFATKMLKR
jgi:hypothetical protein